MENNTIQRHLMKFAFIPLALFLFTLTLTVAQADGGGTYSVYDTDSDGYLDRTEYVKFYNSKRKRSKNLDNWIFDTVDSDGDNKISEQEMVDALIKDMKQKK